MLKRYSEKKSSYCNAFFKNRRKLFKKNNLKDEHISAKVTILQAFKLLKGKLILVWKQ